MSAIADRLLAVTTKFTTARAAAEKDLGRPRYDGPKNPAHLFGGGPSDAGAGPGIVPLQKAAAYCAGVADDGDPDVREAVDLSERIKAVWGGVMPFSGRPRSLAIPASASHLPVVAHNGYEVPGARALVKEIGQRVAAVNKTAVPDPDDVRRKAVAGDRLARKVLSTLSELSGGSTVPPPTLGDLIDLQRNREVFTTLGATNITLPPNGRIDLPKLTGGATAYWVGETQAITASQQTTGMLKLEAHKLALRVEVTNELMRFSDTSIDAMIRTDLAAQGALAADLSMLQGTGGTQIKGLITYETQTTWTQGTDKLLAYTVTANKFQPNDVVAMLAALPDRVRATGWVMRPDLYAVLRNRRADAVSAADGKGPFVFDITRSAETGIDPWEGLLANVPVVTSRQVVNTRGSGSQTYIIVGNFADWVIGRLGVFEFMTDPYTQMVNYQTVIQCVQFVDAGARHPASFVFADSVDVS